MYCMQPSIKWWKKKSTKNNSNKDKENKQEQMLRQLKVKSKNYKNHVTYISQKV